MEDETPPSNVSERETRSFPVCDPLRERGCKHCIALFVLENSGRAQPTLEHDNATLTFVELNGRIYGVTCQHVIDIVQGRNRAAGGHAFDLFTVVEKLVFIGIERFLQPGDLSGGRAPDIAIRQLHPDYPAAVGKIPISLSQPPESSKIEHLIAVGYPTAIKQPADDVGRVAIPCIHALAEQVAHSERTVRMFSILAENPGIDSFSGMSGGPVYWSTPELYGLAGITYEAAPPNEMGVVPDSRISIVAETVSLDRFSHWVSQVPVLF